ncbi:MAG TPA: signal peptidase I [Verrucomicrobiae bacterium]|jgi:signal peptidase I|nr:signal peptidase I [Verrucomicrobiae bacterium]
MKPEYLLLLVAAILVIRIVLTVRSKRANATGASMTVAKEYLDPFIVAGLAAWVLITFVARTYYIPSESMVPTLLVHDVLLVDKISYRLHAPHDGDIAVFPPPVPTDDDFIKRVMGQPGDTFRIQQGVVYRNGVALVEPYINATPVYNLKIANYGIYEQDMGETDWQRIDPTQANIPPKSQWTAPDRIPPHCYFMMGDNRNNSEDSHIWGFAQDAGTFATGPRAGTKGSFTGRAFVVFWPFNRIKILHRT